jgi:hypothetical protein
MRRRCGPTPSLAFLGPGVSSVLGWRLPSSGHSVPTRSFYDVTYRNLGPQKSASFLRHITSDDLPQPEERVLKTGGASGPLPPPARGIQRYLSKRPAGSSGLQTICKQSNRRNRGQPPRVREGDYSPAVGAGLALPECEEEPCPLRRDEVLVEKIFAAVRSD